MNTAPERKFEIRFALGALAYPEVIDFVCAGFALGACVQSALGALGYSEVIDIALRRLAAGALR